MQLPASLWGLASSSIILQFYKFPIVSYIDFKALLLIFKALQWFVSYYIWLGYCYCVSMVSH